jgi:hypothetical protein
VSNFYSASDLVVEKSCGGRFRFALMPGDNFLGFLSPSGNTFNIQLRSVFETLSASVVTLDTPS